MSKIAIDVWGCWIWQGSKHPFGYGRFSVAGKPERAHRVAYALFCGPVHKEDVICHTCDVPSCVNPNHLWKGSHGENADDRERKGRGVVFRGEQHGKAKLRIEQVREIRRSSGSSSVLAEAFGVTPSQIRMIKSFRQWKGVA